jgi:hypothetical protein
MKKSDLKPGTRVIACVPRDEWSDESIVKYFHDDWNETTLAGAIIDKPAKTGKVWVAWDECDHRGEGEEQEVKIDILTLESELPEIEKDYKEVTKLIKKNMQDAAKLIRESNQLAKKAHAASLESMYDAVQPLVSAMDSSGWRSSSWGC